jgi:hypothetical protein
MTDPKLYALFCEYIDDFNEMRSADRGCGIGLGSEISQPIALDYASPIDHYMKDTLRIKGYARHMDDGYVISNSLDFLKEIKKTFI